MSGGPGSGFDFRQKRLRMDRRRMELIAQESDYVKPVPVLMPGSEPEKYIVTFHCRGIVGIDSNREPIYGDRHEVEIYCDSEYPADPPKLKWLTDIWHPNIEHRDPKRVCVNKGEWLAFCGLDHLCWQMFDMVQYRNYHATLSHPFPLDQEAAAWVREFAEPRGIVNKRRHIAIDDKPFFRPQSRAQLEAVADTPPPKPQRGVRFLNRPASQDRPPDQESSRSGNDLAQDTSRKVRFVQR